MPSAMGSKSKSQPKGDPALNKAGLQLMSTTTLTETPIEAADSGKKSKRKRSDEAVGERVKRPKKVPLAEEGAPVTPRLSRKKSVTFTPETKVEDGDSIKQLFNSWVAEQKIQDPNFQLSTSAPAFQIPEPPRVEEIIDTTLDEKERRVKRVKEKKPKTPKIVNPPENKKIVAPTPTDNEPRGKRAKEKKPKAVKGSKVVKPSALPPPPSRPFLDYLKQYSESRPTWKFNKNHQNHIIKHIFNVDIIPSSHAHFIYEYVRRLQGGVRTRLRDAALAIKVKDIEEGAEGFPETMGQAEKRQREYEEAVSEYVATMTASNAPCSMGYEEGILLGLSDVAMRNRAAKRMRTEKILAELASSPDPARGPAAFIMEEQKTVQVADGTQKVVRKRKQRTIMMEIKSDSSSDSSSSDSDDSSSDDESTNNEASKTDTSSSSSSSSSSSGSDDNSSGDSSSGSEDSEGDSD